MSLFKRLIRSTISQASYAVAKLRPKLIQDLECGSNTRIYGDVRFRVTDGGYCYLGNNVVVERFCEVTASGGSIKIGDNSFIGQGSIIVSKSSIFLGSNCLIAENVTIRDQNHRFALDRQINESGFKVGVVYIGDNVWIGAKACILPGVIIGEGVIVGAGSVVTKSLPSRVVAAGNPARVIRNY